jgi:hypothetical protein
MRTISEAPPASRTSIRPFLTGAVVVALAVAGLAFLSEAFASGGQTVYLANIQPGGRISRLSRVSSSRARAGRRPRPSLRSCNF